MSELHARFDDLLRQYSGLFRITTSTESTYAGLAARIPAMIPGVYVIRMSGTGGRALYIGSAGKIHKGMTPSASTIRSRMLNSLTPYRLDKTHNVFRYQPTTAGVPPAGYRAQVALSDLNVMCMEVRQPVAPAVLEHLLIQAHINQFGDLPAANQKV
jgi:hypothetical protein